MLKNICHIVNFHEVLAIFIIVILLECTDNNIYFGKVHFSESELPLL